jgi:hypothetical protein
LHAAVLLVLSAASAGSLPAQPQLVRDPGFADSTAWQKLNEHTIIGGWGPAKIWLGSEKERYTVGLAQDVKFPEDGWYQMAFTGGGGDPDGAPMSAACGPLFMRLRNVLHVRNDYGMVTSYVRAGTHKLTVSLVTGLQYPFWGYFVRCEIRKVELPSVNWRLESEVDYAFVSIYGTAHSQTTADLAVLMLGAKRLPQGLALSGFHGLLWVDPAGALLMPQVPSSRFMSWDAFWRRLHDWPRLHAQILEIDVNHPAGPIFRLGSPSFSLIAE